MHVLTVMQQKEKVYTVDPTKLFEIKFQNKLQCSMCSGSKYSYATEVGLNLSVPVEKDSVDLTECLNEYFGTGVSSDWDCPIDKQKTNVYRLY